MICVDFWARRRLLLLNRLAVHGLGSETDSIVGDGAFWARSRLLLLNGIAVRKGSSFVGNRDSFFIAGIELTIFCVGFWRRLLRLNTTDEREFNSNSVPDGSSFTEIVLAISCVGIRARLLLLVWIAMHGFNLFFCVWSRLLLLEGVERDISCARTIFSRFSSKNSLKAFSYPFLWIFWSTIGWIELGLIVCVKPEIGTLPLKIKWMVHFIHILCKR